MEEDRHLYPLDRRKDGLSVEEQAQEEAHLLMLGLDKLTAHRTVWQQKRADLRQRLATIENASLLLKEKVGLHQLLVEELIHSVQAGKVPSLLHSKTPKQRRRISVSHQPGKLNPAVAAISSDLSAHPSPIGMPGASAVSANKEKLNVVKSPSVKSGFSKVFKLRSRS